MYEMRDGWNILRTQHIDSDFLAEWGIVSDGVLQSTMCLSMNGHPRSNIRGGVGDDKSLSDGGSLE